MMTDVYALADQIRKDLFDQLQEWRDKNITLIEQMYKQKQIELNEKIGQFDKMLSAMKIEKQTEISEIKEKVTKLIDAGEATFDQVDRLRQLVNTLALDIDKLRIPTIRIETQPTNVNTCQIIDVNDVRYTKPRDSTVLSSNTRINDDDRQFNRSTDHFRPLTNQSMTTRENSESKLLDPYFDPHMSPYLPYVPKSMQYPIHPYTPPPYRPPKLIEDEPPNFITSHYPPLPSMPPFNSSPYFLNMSQYPNYSKQNSSESEDSFKLSTSPNY
jgi:hypothetical protein